MVSSLNLGAVKGLKALDQIPQCYTKAQVKDAFVKLYEHLDKELTEEEQRYIGFDPITVEHLLCKYQRLYPDTRGRASDKKGTVSRKGQPKKAPVKKSQPVAGSVQKKTQQKGKGKAKAVGTDDEYGQGSSGENELE